MSSPGVVNLNVYQGDRFELFFRVRSMILSGDGVTLIPGDYIDLTGWTPSAEIRKTKADDDVVGTFVCTLSDQIAVPGGVLCVLLPSVTVGLVDSPYFYDVQLEEDADHITTYLQGQVLVTGEVTRG